MAITHTWKTSVTVPGLATLPTDAAVVISGDTATDFEKVVPAGTVAEIDCGEIDLLKLVSFVFHSTAVDLPVSTNAADATGGQEIDLKAGKAYGWYTSIGFSNPITDNITKLFLDNTLGAKDTIFRCGFLSVLSV